VERKWGENRGGMGQLEVTRLIGDQAVDPCHTSWIGGDKVGFDVTGALIRWSRFDVSMFLLFD
jgi:hypothetical protein